MNIDIFRYIDGQMDDSEKSRFEELLDSDVKLKNEYNSIAGSMNELKELSKADDTGSEYFSLVSANFRQKLDKRKSFSFKPAFRYAVSLSSFAIVFVISMLIMNNNVSTKKSTISQLYESFNENEKKEFVKEAAGKIEIDDEEIADLDVQREKDIESKFADELYGENLGTEVQLSNSDYQNIVNNLSVNEAEALYNEVIN